MYKKNINGKNKEEKKDGSTPGRYNHQKWQCLKIIFDPFMSMFIYFPQLRGVSTFLMLSLYSLKVWLPDSRETRYVPYKIFILYTSRLPFEKMSLIMPDRRIDILHTTYQVAS